MPLSRLMQVSALAAFPLAFAVFFQATKHDTTISTDRSADHPKGGCVPRAKDMGLLRRGRVKVEQGDERFAQDRQRAFLHADGVLVRVHEEPHDRTLMRTEESANPPSIISASRGA